MYMFFILCMSLMVTKRERSGELLTSLLSPSLGMFYLLLIKTFLGVTLHMWEKACCTEKIAHVFSYEFSLNKLADYFLISL